MVRTIRSRRAFIGGVAPKWPARRVMLLSSITHAGHEGHRFPERSFSRRSCTARSLARSAFLLCAHMPTWTPNPDPIGANPAIRANASHSASRYVTHAFWAALKALRSSLSLRASSSCRSPSTRCSPSSICSTRHCLRSAVVSFSGLRQSACPGLANWAATQYGNVSAKTTPAVEGLTGLLRVMNVLHVASGRTSQMHEMTSDVLAALCFQQPLDVDGLAMLERAFGSCQP